MNLKSYLAEGVSSLPTLEEKEKTGSVIRWRDVPVAHLHVKGKLMSSSVVFFGEGSLDLGLASRYLSGLKCQQESAAITRLVRTPIRIPVNMLYINT